MNPIHAHPSRPRPRLDAGQPQPTPARGWTRLLALALALGGAAAALAQAPQEAPPRGAGPDFDGPPPLGPGGFVPGGAGGPGGFGPSGGAMEEMKLVKEFDRNGDGWLNAEERKAAREHLRAQGGPRRGPGGRRGGFGPRGESQEPPQPGARLTPAEVKHFPEAPLYASNVLRTLFLEFESADWEKELADFKNTDVEVPAKLIVDGATYRDVGVHFHGASSYMMLGEGQKRSLTLTLDCIHDNQSLLGYRKLNLLNAHEDPSFLRTVLALQMARAYLPAPKANLVRVVINGESWGLFVNQQHFNKEFLRDAYGTNKGARWKVPGSPNGRGGLNYLGDDPAPYRRIYEIKTKDDPAAWAALIRFCRVLEQTPAAELEQALEPLLDIDETLRFLAWENVVVNGDGYWTRASDYSLYLDAGGKFHVLPYDANETFSAGGGPGGPGGPGGRGGFAGPGGPGGFGPGLIVARQFLDRGDENDDGKLSKTEFTALAEAWCERLDPDQTDALTLEQFSAQLGELLPPPPGFGPPPGPGDVAGGQNPAARVPGARGGAAPFGPAAGPGLPLYQALDANRDRSLTRAEIRGAFAKWFADWDTAGTGTLNEEALRKGLDGVLPQLNFGGPGGMAGGGRMEGPGRMDGPGGMGNRGRGGFGGPGGPRGGGVQLDPLVGLNDASKPLLSKLLAAPALRARYLGYVRDMAGKWLDWHHLGPLAQQYHDLIAADVKADTRKLDSTEAFLTSLTGGGSAETPRAERGFRGPRSISLKDFAEQRRAYLLNYKEPKPASD